MKTVTVDLASYQRETARMAEMQRRIEDLKFVIEVLRMYGNKDCTAMADEQIAKRRSGQKCDFED